MKEFIKKLFKTTTSKPPLRVCNNCAFRWYPEETSTRRNGYFGGGLMFCPDCGDLDTQVENDWHRANAYKMKRWREDYLKNRAESEKADATFA
jgi:hypothetical protein